jgi:hypothetical protein
MQRSRVLYLEGSDSVNLGTIPYGQARQGDLIWRGPQQLPWPIQARS